MKFRDVRSWDLFRIDKDYTRSILRRQWSINEDGIGFNAVFVGGIIGGTPAWVDDEVDVTKVKSKRKHK